MVPLLPETGQNPACLPTLEIDGADGQTVIIPAGQWYMSPKARPQRLMRNSLSTEGRQVYACLELRLTMGRQELAVKMVKGEPVPITAADLAEQTGLSLQLVRRALIELENRHSAAAILPDDGPRDCEKAGLRYTRLLGSSTRSEIQNTRCRARWLHNFRAAWSESPNFGKQSLRRFLKRWNPIIM